MDFQKQRKNVFSNDMPKCGCGLTHSGLHAVGARSGGEATKKTAVHTAVQRVRFGGGLAR